jgi:glycosyltransferase involved in cell wall biosynthesis
LPFAKTKYPAYLPLMPLALEMMDMREYDVIVSSEAGPAKWIIPNPDAKHICYCHSPMRYIWDQRQIYFDGLPGALRFAAEMYASRLRKSDILSSTRVDTFVANSGFVAQRINKYYRRDAHVVHPPVDLEKFIPSLNGPEDYYLVAGEVAPYKRVDLAVQACNELGRRLIVIGGGKGVEKLKQIAGSTVEIKGKVSDEQFRTALSKCRALLFPGVEDFGLVPVEAMASGRPVIAYAKGGALDSVKDGVSGMFFHEPTANSLKEAILEFERQESAFTVEGCLEHARSFGREQFVRKFKNIVLHPN